MNKGLGVYCMMSISKPQETKKNKFTAELILELTIGC